LKQSINFASGIHILDEDLLLPRTVIEKRHHLYKVIATSISFDWFGNQVWEETPEDSWLISAIRERIGDQYKKQKCGVSFYRYQLAKKMKKFYKLVK
jgi:hypothetical protein